MSRVKLALLLLAAGGMAIGMAATAADKPATDPNRLQQLAKEGNYKEAYEGYAALVLDARTDPMRVGEYLANAVGLLGNLERVDEMDDFVEKAVATHPKNWRLLQAAAQLYANAEHYGFIVAGKFARGWHRGGDGKQVGSSERDRVRALQLLQEGIRASRDLKGPDLAQFYWRIAESLNRNTYEAWRLQYLTDLTTLPDYEEGYYYGYGGEARGAPVNEDGTPVYHRLPASWEDAKSDGERWRWALMQAAEMDASQADRASYAFASFLHEQFGAQTMAQYEWFRSLGEDDARKDESGVWELHTLGRDETIARLANGVKRFKLPDEFNFIRIFDSLANKSGEMQDGALQALARIFSDRRQYDDSAEYWRRSIALGDPYRYKQDQLDQIVKNWGQFEPAVTQPAGQGAQVGFRFRNGDKVKFTAYEVDLRKVLDGLKSYLKSNPQELDWRRVSLAEIGNHERRDVADYLGAKAAEWDLALEPRPKHFDRRVSVATPLQKAGAYWLTAEMKDGNTSDIVIWIADTVIAQKPMGNKDWYFVADALTGAPIAKANVEFFGYRSRWIDNGGRYLVDTMDSAEFTDANGQLTQQLEQNYTWMAIATTPDGRLAYTGFQGVWRGRVYDQEYNERKAFVITDRPVYRPEQTVKFKFWLSEAKYDLEGNSPFAGQTFTVEIKDPKGEKVFTKSYTADQYGGFDGEYALPDEATLGAYWVWLPNSGFGGGSFRVEEYKKPEFEVKVEAPTEPVMLGEKITATVAAKYYFGAPVTSAKVKYKVLRSDYDGVWYPSAYWDWCFGRGYWWFACDYEWYPGWSDWGCPRPWPWWRHRGGARPEVVAEAEARLDAEGKLKIEIDTALAKAVHADTDHRYEVTAEVTDESRRTIVGQGQVLVARKPFKVYAWVNRGHYKVGDVIQASFNAQTLDSRPVAGKGEVALFKVSYDKDLKPVETAAQEWPLDPDAEGRARLQIKASEPGQYRLRYAVTDAKDHRIEGGYVFCVVGQGFESGDFRFNELELTPDKAEYIPGEKAQLMVNTNRNGAWVLLFERPANGVYLAPELRQLSGKSWMKEISVGKRDMPNFFVEALTVYNGRVYTETRELYVPPENRVLNVSVTPLDAEYRPGEKAKVTVAVTEPSGEPFAGSLVLSVYDKAVEYVSGGSNVSEIKAFFWQWRRNHNPVTTHTLDRVCHNIARDAGMQALGVFGGEVDSEELADMNGRGGGLGGGLHKREMLADAMSAPKAALAMSGSVAMDAESAGAPPAGGEMAAPTVRTEFADTALWVAALSTDAEGKAEVELKMPENLTTWKARVWAMGAGTRVGEGSAEVVTTKKVIVRLQAPRFFVQKDEVVLSANIHNYLKSDKRAKAVLTIEGRDGARLEPVEGKSTATANGFEMAQVVDVPRDGEKRVDWRVRVLEPGVVVARMQALTDEESDAMEMKFPAYVHGMLKMESFCGVIRPEKDRATVTIKVPKERRPEQTRLEARYSPTLAAAMVDALPYLADYPYGCTEQTLNRFLPAVITQNTLRRMGLNLKDIQEKRANLNAQEIGDDAERAKQWKRFDRNPVFEEETLRDMVKAGVNRLTAMQCGDGGWGWFSGWGEHSWPHTTAVVVHGLQVARNNDVAIVPGVLERGVEWLKRCQAEQLRLLRNGDKDPRPMYDCKLKADALDALVYMVLVDAGADDKDMRDYLYRDRNDLPVYAKAMFGLMLHKVGDIEKRDMLIRNVEQYLVQDDENQTAWLRLPEGGWWYWYGSEYEAHAYYLKLLAATDPANEKASRLVKYLLNNRKHSTYWNSTRDTAICVEAFADYIKASGEDQPDMTVNILIDGKKVKEARITRDNLFTFDNKLTLEGDALESGEHKIEFVRQGKGPLYFNAYLTNFTLEDPITRAGLEIKVNRKMYLLKEADKTIKAPGSRGQALDQRVEKYERKELENLATLKSGDLVEVELEIESKNDYEYIVFEDMKAAGFEPVETRSGYGGNDLGAYMELRDERVVFFVRALARGKHSVSYRLRAEIPGKFSALPAKAAAMYAPELKANSDEIKLRIED